MNRPFNLAPSIPSTVMPVEFAALAPPPLLLPGESLERYGQLRQAIFDDLAPRSAIEWLLAIDLVDISWEIQRYRILRHKLLEAYRQKAVEVSLRRVDMAMVSPELESQAEAYTVQNALSWRLDPLAASDIEDHLAAYGFDQHAISMEVYAQARETFLMFEGLLNAAQARRLLLLKEIKSYRSFLLLKESPRNQSARPGIR